MDATSFAREVQARERTLYRIAVSILGNDADAADAVQDALLRAWEKRYTLREPAYFGTWLTRIVINCAREQLRRRRPQRELLEGDAVTLDRQAEDLALKTALEQLDIKYRLPLLLYHLEGYTTKEVASILLIPQGTVTSRIARGREKLRMLLEEKEGVLAHVRH